MSKERPILFSAPMVRAILDGSKTQTRRIMKPQPTLEGTWVQAAIRGGTASYGSEQGFRESHPGWCPHGWEGDRLWVRETWRVAACYDDKSGTELTSILSARNVQYEVAADRFLHGDAIGRVRPSIHMPRWASRIDLEITGVRVERLQDISEADAVWEGYRGYGVDGENICARTWYQRLWESINGPGSWGANPWVWVVEFRKAMTKE